MATIALDHLTLREQQAQRARESAERWQQAKQAIQDAQALLAQQEHLLNSIQKSRQKYAKSMRTK